MNPPLIGVMGKKRSGKDTFASFLVDGYGYRRVAFADPLKEALLKVDPIIPTNPTNGFDRYGEGQILEAMRLSKIIERFGWEGAKAEPEVRRLLQEYGVTIRSYQPDFWLRIAMAKASSLRVGSNGSPVIITDVRFPNEADAIREAGGILVRVLRPGLASDDTHESETALDDYSGVTHQVRNDGTLTDLATMASLIHRSALGR